MAKGNPGRRGAKLKRAAAANLQAGDTGLNVEQNNGPEKKGKASKTQHSKSPKDTKNELCSICLNQFLRPSVLSGCFHQFCFSCITKWAGVSSNCPVCRKDYKNILHNFNTPVRVVRVSDERPSKKKQKLAQSQDAPQEADGETDVNSPLKRDPVYVFEANAQSMIGLPIIDDEQLTNNIVQLSMNNINQIPEIDIMNMTKNESGGRIITRHNYQLACGDQQELINGLLSSAINRSVEEHQETISLVGPNASKEQAKSILGQTKGLTRLIDVYTLDRTRVQKRRRGRPRGSGRGGVSVRSPYNLRAIEGVTRENPQVNRARLFEQWQL